MDPTWRDEAADDDLDRRWSATLDAFEDGPKAKPLPISRRLPSLRRSPWARDLNKQQQAAFDAMTTSGGCLVWGEHGVGKTTVVAAAVGAAIQKGQTVLLTAPDEWAVDDALTALIGVDPGGQSVLAPGVVVRLPIGAVADAVSDHPALMADKAAATLVRRDQRLDAIARTEQANRNDPARSSELWLRLRVQEDDKEGTVRRLDEQRVVYDEWLDWTNRRSLLRNEKDELLASIAATQKTLATYDGADAKVSALTADMSSESRQRDSRLRQVQALTAQLDEATRRRAVQQAQLTEIQTLGPEWDDQRASLEDSLDDLNDLIDDLGDGLRLPREELAAHEARASSIEQRLNDALSVQEASDAVQQRLQDLQREVDIRNLAMRDCEQEMAVRRRVLGDPPAWLEHYQQVDAAGKFSQVHRWEEAAQQVMQLNDELEQLAERRAKVEEDYQQKWLALPSEALVIAAPIDALVLEDGLANRRFDVVIIDDAGEADAEKVTFAASLANRTCAIVGGPQDVEPNRTPEPQPKPPPVDEQFPWRVNWKAPEPEPQPEPEPEDEPNIFALAGITDQQSAEKHPHCKVLTR